MHYIHYFTLRYVTLQYIYTYMYIYIHIHTYICMYTHACVYVNTNHIYIYTHINIYKCIPTRRTFFLGFKLWSSSRCIWSRSQNSENVGHKPMTLDLKNSLILRGHPVGYVFQCLLALPHTLATARTGQNYTAPEHALSGLCATPVGLAINMNNAVPNW